MRLIMLNPFVSLFHEWIGLGLQFEQLEVNDSFVVQGVKLQSVCNSNYRASKRLGRKFVARVDGEGVAGSSS